MDDNLSRYDQVFIEALDLEESQLSADLLYQSVPNWDSVGHMQLISGLEDVFDIMFDTDDIIDFNSYEAGKKIIAGYGVEL